MSKLVKAIFISAYAALFIQYLKTSLPEKKYEVIEVDYMYRTPGTFKKLNRELKKYRKNITMLNTNFTNTIRLPTDLKFILKWTKAYSHYNTPNLRNGQYTFLDSNCTNINCFMTDDKSLLINPRNFDAILFDVENNWDEHPIFRTPQQTFIFTASESASNFPICHHYFDSYYNWTWSYKLNSVINKPFIYIYDKKGQLVGPKINMSWIDPMKPTPDEVKKRLVNKRKAIAWFVSSCRTQSQRELVANNLTRALKEYNLRIDIYGWCGKLACPQDRMEDCLELLEDNYYFYLSFENSLSEDYVTEKVLHPLLHYTVPIVYGGANYSRFLPPGSYINAGEQDAASVASLISQSMKDREVYQNYFRWHNHYVYKDSPKEPDVCSLCKMLNEAGHHDSVVKDFRKWWYSDYESVCTDKYFQNAYNAPSLKMLNN